MKIDFNKILCFIGWHNWTWTYDPSDYTQHQFCAPPPDHAKCSKCGVTYNE